LKRTRLRLDMMIIHVNECYHPVLGGLEKVVQKIAEHQAKLGYEVHVITSRYGAESECVEEELNDVHVHRVKAWKLYYQDLMIPREFCEGLLREADVVHVHSQNSLFNVILGKKAKKMFKPVVINFLALDYVKLHTNRLIRFFGGLYQEWIQREAVGIVDKAIAINERDHRILKEKYNVESEIVPHGIDEKYLTRPKDERTFREKYEVYEENIIAYIGRIHPSKGLDVLVKALPLIARKAGNFTVVIAGGGSEAYRRSLLKLSEKLRVEHRVRILGYISEDEKISLLDASKIFVLPTRHFGEAYPLVVDEAYARGVPLVVTDAGALPYRVKHLETGMIAKMNNPESLAEAVIALLTNDDLYSKIREKVKRVKILTWRQVCERISKIYEDIHDVN